MRKELTLEEFLALEIGQKIEVECLCEEKLFEDAREAIVESATTFPWVEGYVPSFEKILRYKDCGKGYDIIEEDFFEPIGEEEVYAKVYLID
ncbi:MAG: hypothetical protein ACRDDY_13095 [Clostridium sp.]|uniref:hypothetical protein n=1 Tax=Clostridium sp. TaxID=1506 RepID=UPI003EE76839